MDMDTVDGMTVTAQDYRMNEIEIIQPEIEEEKAMRHKMVKRYNSVFTVIDIVKKTVSYRHDVHEHHESRCSYDYTRCKHSHNNGCYHHGVYDHVLVLRSYQ